MPAVGHWAHPDAINPESAGQAPSSVGIVGNEVIAGQGLDSSQQTGGNGFQRDSNGSESVGIGVGIQEADNPLSEKRNSADYHHSNDSNGFEHTTADYPDLPEGLRRIPNGGNGLRPPRGKGWVQVGDKPVGQAGAVVFLRERWRPGLGPPGDDVFDLDPGWRQ
jgi:hypothetical protein